MPKTVDSVREYALNTLYVDMHVPGSPSDVADATPLGATGIDLDSLMLIEFTTRVQRHFEVTIPDADLESIGAMSFGELVNYIAARPTES